MIIPHFQHGEGKFDLILVCWDGSHTAARAIADAMPFLTRAKQVEVVTVATGGKADHGIPGLSIAHHLSRHGVIVLEKFSLTAKTCHLEFVLTQRAIRRLIVMGAMVIRGFVNVLGGATRTFSNRQFQL